MASSACSGAEAGHLPRAGAVSASDMDAGGRSRKWPSFSDGSESVLFHRSESHSPIAMMRVFCLPGCHLSCYTPGIADESHRQTEP